MVRLKVGRNGCDVSQRGSAPSIVRTGLDPRVGKLYLDVLNLMAHSPVPQDADGRLRAECEWLRLTAY